MNLFMYYFKNQIGKLLLGSDAFGDWLIDWLIVFTILQENAQNWAVYDIKNYIYIFLFI